MYNRLIKSIQLSVDCIDVYLNSQHDFYTDSNICFKFVYHNYLIININIIILSCIYVIFVPHCIRLFGIYFFTHLKHCPLFDKYLLRSFLKLMLSKLQKYKIFIITYVVQNGIREIILFYSLIHGTT